MILLSKGSIRMGSRKTAIIFYWFSSYSCLGTIRNLPGNSIPKIKFYDSQPTKWCVKDNSSWADLLAHQSRRLMGELIVYQSLRRPSFVRPQFQTSSPLKPLGQLNSNYIWRLLRTRERKFVQMVLVTWPRWPPRPYMVKTF